MNNTQALDEQGYSHHMLCKIFVYGASAVLILQVITSVIFMIHFALLSSSDIQIINNGSGYSFALPLGYARFSYEYLGRDITIQNTKLFCITYLIARTITTELPILIILNYFRKVLGFLKKGYSPFTLEIIRYIKKIGMGLIYMGCFSKLLLQIALNMAADGTMMFANPLQLSYIFAGFVVLLLGDIFRRGCTLQREYDETL